MEYYFQNMNFNKVNDDKIFWKTVKPRFWNKYKTANTIILTERYTIMKNDKLITETLNLKIYPNFDDQSLFSITNEKQ